MSISASGGAVSVKPLVSAQGTGDKGKAASGQDTESAESGDFLTLLTSMEPGQAGADAAALSEPPVAEPAPEDLVGADLPGALVPGLPFDMTMLLTQASQLTGAPAAPAAQTGRPEADRPALFKLDSLASSALVSADKPEMTPGDAALPDVGRLAGFEPESGKALAGAAQALPHQAANSKVQRDGLAAAAVDQAELRVLKQEALSVVSTREPTREPALVGALASNGAANQLLRQIDRGNAKISATLAGADGEGSWGHQALMAGHRTEAPLAATVNPPMPAFAAMVADKVNYWLSQGVQNAQMKLDGFGDQSVEVSISLKGDVAHIGFRTDQAEMRQMLQGAESALKEMLMSEGLSLAGVTVGSSGQDSAGGQEPRERPATRQATMASAQQMPVDARQRAHHSVGRSVDLFV